MSHNSSKLDSDDSKISSKLDSTLTPKLLTYSRKYKRREKSSDGVC